MSSKPELIYKEAKSDKYKEKEFLEEKIEELNKMLRETNEKLSFTISYYKDIINNVQSGILIFDKNINAITANPYFNKLLENQNGSSPLVLFSLYLKLDKKNLYDGLKNVVSKGKVWKMESVEFNTPSRKSCKLNVTSSPIKNIDGVIAGGNLVVEDITEKVKLEKELSISKRFASLGRFSGKIAHELNNPLDGILRFTNLAISLNNEDYKLKNYLLQSKKGIEKIIDIVKSSLSLSRTSYYLQGKTSINNILKDVVTFLEHKIISQKIKITFDLDTRVSSIHSGDFFLAFINIVKNSLNAMPYGGNLKITSTNNGTNDIIIFKDNGTGIPHNILHRIFDPFFTTKEDNQGTGLGLVICEDIIRRYGGNISVGSLEGKGTTFKISIPV